MSKEEKEDHFLVHDLETAKESKNVDVHNIEPDLMDLYFQKYDLKDKLAGIDKFINEYQSEKINALRQVEGLKKYTGESKFFKISYNPPKEYHSWVVKADPQQLGDFLTSTIISEYGTDSEPRFKKLIHIIVESLLDRKIGYEKYEVRRHKKPIDRLHKTALEVSIVTDNKE